MKQQNIDLANISIFQGFNIYGASSGDLSGSSSKYVGDINNDGFADIIISAPSAYKIAKGIAYIIYGKAHHNSIDLNTLSKDDGFVIYNTRSFAPVGDPSISTAGDFNNDGFDDIIIGRAEKGSFLIYGNSTNSDIDLLNFDSHRGMIIYSEVNSMQVSTAGDFNNDNIDDIIIAMPTTPYTGEATYWLSTGEKKHLKHNNKGLENRESRIGITYVIFGKTTPPASIDLSNLANSDGLVIYGAIKDGFSGSSVASAGDFNNDGYDDIIIGADHANKEGRYDAGIAYLIYGKAQSTNIELSKLSTDDGFIIYGAALDRIGTSIGSAGDFNNDGFSDIVIGGLPFSREPKTLAYIIYGTKNSYNSIDLANGININQGFVIIGEPQRNSGASGYIRVAAAGDVNKDGYSDIILGANYMSPNLRKAAGISFIIYGHNNNGNIDLSNLGDKGFSIYGAVSSDNSGWSVDSAGDFNNDGYTDVVIGAWGWGSLPQKTKFNAGISYVVYGSASEQLTAIPTKLISTSFILPSLPTGKEILIYDYNNNKKADIPEEARLTEWCPKAKTDFEALLCNFDTNKDKIFNKDDREFNKFYLWQDNNEDGISQSDELKSLSEVEIIAIDFRNIESISNELEELGATTKAEVLWTNGKVTYAYDLAFTHDAVML